MKVTGFFPFLHIALYVFMCDFVVENKMHLVQFRTGAHCVMFCYI